MDFIAFCARGHDRIDFDGDREGFERHMISVHDAKPPHAGGPVVPDAGYRGDYNRAIAAPGWRNGRISPPHAWKAPRPDADGGAKRLDKWVATRELVIGEVGDDETARAS